MKPDEIQIIKIPSSRWAEFKELRLKGLKQYPHAYSNGYEEEAMLPDEAWKEKIERPNVVALFASYNDKLIGMSGFGISDKPKIKHFGEVIYTYVDNAYTNKGVGSMIFDALINEARNKGLEKLSLAVVTVQIPAIKLYEKFGFVSCGIEHKYIKVGEEYYDILRMEKFL